jgi:hypothetical protein
MLGCSAVYGTIYDDVDGDGSHDADENEAYQTT